MATLLNWTKIVIVTDQVYNEYDSGKKYLDYKSVIQVYWRLCFLFKTNLVQGLQISKLRHSTL